MAQRTLEPGEIETLAQRDIPRIILPERGTLFPARAERLRALVEGNPIGGYLAMLAVVVDAQQAELDGLTAVQLQALQQSALAQQPAAAADAGMPPLHAASLRRDAHWRVLLRSLCRRCAGHAGFPDAVGATLARVIEAPDDWLEGQADALLEVPGAPPVDVAAAPLVMAALQVYWLALGLAFRIEALAPMADAPGLCPLCGFQPVSSMVHAKAPHAAYRYLACGLCACQWHYVRVQCSRCGTAGKDIAYQSLTALDASADAIKAAPVRAETCEHCHGYRKILYEEFGPEVEPLADDLGTLALDILLGEQGYERASQNPLLWHPEQE